MLPVEVDVPELLVEMGYGKSGTLHAKAIRDLALIAFYYLLRVGKYGERLVQYHQTNSTIRTQRCLFLQKEQGRDPSVPSLGHTPQSHNDS